MNKTSNKKRKYGCPDPLSIHKATAAINEGLTIRKAAELYNIPKSTLYDHFSQRIEPGAVPGRAQAIPGPIERRLVEQVMAGAAKGFGITEEQLCIKTSRLVRRLNLQTPFRNDIPGQHWIRGLKKRHPELVLRRPQKLSINRSRMMNRGKVSAYFTDLHQTITKLNLVNRPQCIWNVDETNIQMEHRPARVLAHKGIFNSGAIIFLLRLVTW